MVRRPPPVIEIVSASDLLHMQFVLRTLPGGGVTAVRRAGLAVQEVGLRWNLVR